MSKAGDDNEDDFAHRASLCYPPIIFANVDHPDDEAMLRVLFMVMNAIDLNIHKRQYDPLVTFLPIVYDEGLREYTFVGEVLPTVEFSARLLNTIWSTNPVRIRAMYIEPYQEAPQMPWKIRIIIKIRSMRSEVLPRSFECFLRSDKTLLRPGFEKSVYEGLPVTSMAHKEESDIIEKIRDTCEKLVTLKSVIPHISPEVHYKTRENVATQRNQDGTATVCWKLPKGVGIDIISAAEMLSDIGNVVDDISYGMRISETDPAVANLTMTVFLFSPTSRTVRLIQTQNYVYYKDPHASESDAWKFDVCGPQQTAKNSAGATRRERGHVKPHTTTANSVHHTASRENTKKAKPVIIPRPNVLKEGVAAAQTNSHVEHLLKTNLKRMRSTTEESEPPQQYNFEEVNPPSEDVEDEPEKPVPAIKKGHKHVAASPPKKKKRRIDADEEKHTTSLWSYIPIFGSAFNSKKRELSSSSCVSSSSEEEDSDRDKMSNY